MTGVNFAEGPGLPPAAQAGTHAARVLGVIPARLGSQRLPGKPLVRIAGRPLIEWVWRRAMALASPQDGDARGLEWEWVVATDAPEVADAVRGFGGRAVLTRPDHASGTDRVAEVAARPEFRSHDAIVNLQGDEPLLPDGAVEGAVRLVLAGAFEIGTAAVPLRSVEEWRDPAVVKVVVARDGSALYFSRAPIPYPRDGAPGPAELGSGLYLRHVGCYAFRRDALERWPRLGPAPLETAEGLEQLRALYAGWRIGVAVCTGGEPGVDTPADLARVERRLIQVEETER